MGAGASAGSVEINGVKLSDVKAQIGVSPNKNWLDATEIRDLAEAKKEIRRLRRLPELEVPASAPRAPSTEDARLRGNPP